MSTDKPSYTSIEDVRERLAEQSYICDRNIATVVYLATQLEKPLLVEGPAGVGKTELAKVVASSLGAELIRLQCYEGLDESKALYEWEYAKQLLYTQILKDKISEVTHGTKSLAEAVERLTEQDDVFFSNRFILPRPLLRAITNQHRTVLLIDEIDKADSEFEAFLLEILSDFQVTIPELGTVSAESVPVVVLTSNNAREMSDALKRRCLHLYIDFPSQALEEEILRVRIPGLADSLASEVTTVVQKLRTLDLKKAPSISETLDWTRALAVMNISDLGEDVVKDTLSAVCKYEGDLRKAEKELEVHLKKTRAKTEAARAVTTGNRNGEGGTDKDMLH